MTQTYPAVLRDGCIEWIGDPPAGLPAGTPVRVEVVLPATLPPLSDAERGRQMLAIMERLVALGTGEKYGDPVEWQREQRRDRPLPGRES